ncbi:Asp23/Gls24 family envelope stress response protein [Kitasatospora sp. RG8]|uniref:Asp23/Gls24 family envelope stress response protein n=1 Tax=Kitasatospora sp. RG8 TaxID=2820815 RepID=UPI001AE03C66|nr:Asp23/Gls24 family envelope stress response protein [Kitasatospora sp. RG8]MBP0450663.1 Asp23/Gls24 family envelope stress response protein [Kitasatospora sp. RG8]
MTDTSSSFPQGDGRPEDGPQGPSGADRVPEERGKTTIADSVVEKIVGTAARDVPGIHALGAGMSRTIGAVRERVPGGGRASVRGGVKVEVGERQAAVDLVVVVEYGVPITDLAGDVRVSVISAVERLTGLEVVEVNIAVDDVHLPDEDDDTESRVA